MDDLVVENLRGVEVKFKTKPGVFSKHGLDAGTRLLIENMEVRSKGSVIADLGSGTGVVGFIAAKLAPEAHIHLLDDHLRSVELAKENVELNNLRNVEVYLSDLFSAVGERTYHQIFTNPPQSLGNDFLEELISECKRHLKKEGELWLVVKRNLKSVIERILKNNNFSFKIVDSSKEHLVFKAALD